MSKNKLIKIIDTTIIILMVILMFGLPLFFTSYTRSVFEVGKLLILRLFLILTTALWITKVIIINNKEENISEDKTYFKVFGLQWKKCYLEWPLYVWLMVNLLATVFSKNIYISIIGAYDRWEGILTVINYALLLIIFSKLLKSLKGLHLLLWAIIVPTTMSAIYGVYQRFGYDFMHWSVDPTQRVFACINNPVHFCAYVAMVVPLCLAWILYLAKKGNINRYIKALEIFIFISAILIFYTQELSYSRAAWLGFVGAMTVFYMFSTETFNLKSYKELIIDFFATLACLGAIYLSYIFKLYQINKVAIPCLIVILAYIGYSYFIFKDDKNRFYLRLTIIFLFTILQQVSLVWKMRTIYALLTFVFYYFIKKVEGDNRIKHWLVIFLIMFGVVIASEPLVHQIRGKFIPSEEETTKILRTLEEKIKSYNVVAIEGTARTSMWKSAWVWFKDYPLLGTGLDTVKYMYPTYRRPDYGILEGGHNLTPDRVHNEYFNTLITTGILGFISRYILLTGTLVLLVLFGLYKYRGSPLFYIMLASFSGALVYLGQVFFNFGVVATLSLYYVLFGIAAAIAHQKEVWDRELIEEKYQPKIGHYLFYAIVISIAFIISIYLESDYFENLFPFAVFGYFALALIFAYQQGFFSSSYEERDKKQKKVKPEDKFSFESLSWGQTIILSFVWMLVLFLTIPHMWSPLWSPWFAEWHYRKGYELLNMKQYPSAAEELERACKYAPWETHYRIYLGNIYEELGNNQTNTLTKLGAYKQAEKAYTRTIELDPLNPWYLNRLSTVKMSLSQILPGKEKETLKIESERLAERAAKADKNNPIFQLNLGVFKHKINKLDEALISYRRTVEIDGRITDAYLNMIGIYKQKGKMDLALVELDKVVSNNPSARNVHLELGKIYYQMNRKDKALEEFEKEASYNADNIEAYKSLGAFYYQKSDWAKTIEVYEKALQVDQSQIMFKKLLAFSYAKLGRKTEALKYIQEYLTSNPSDQEAQKLLDSVK